MLNNDIFRSCVDLAYILANVFIQLFTVLNIQLFERRKGLFTVNYCLSTGQINILFPVIDFLILQYLAGAKLL